MANTALVTGCNRGIGLEICKILKQKGYDLIGICRKQSPEMQDIGFLRVFDGIDLTDTTSLERISKELSSTKIHLLINNAGMLVDSNLEHFPVQEVERMIALNSIAPVYLSVLMQDQMAENAKVVMITSRMGSMADNNSGGSYGYRMSKAALNAASKSLSIDLRERGIALCLVHPGYIKTGMTHFSGNDTPDHAAQKIVEKIEATNLDNAGTFWHANGEQLPW